MADHTNSNSESDTDVETYLEHEGEIYKTGKQLTIKQLHQILTKILKNNPGDGQLGVYYKENGLPRTTQIADFMHCTGLILYR